MGLAVAAAVYLGFAVAGSAGPAWTGLEALGVSVFGVVAWAGYGRTPLILSSGWTLHVAGYLLWRAGQGGPGR